jgi:hypothetical protein
MKTRITLNELKKINPYQFTRVFLALNKNRAQSKKKSAPITPPNKRELEQYILTQITKK